ncbi:MAG: AraC family transcriptional regulator [Cohaesibacter sp.]|nr:AraC family transcriptional regulator [Cohaesibacter sp.]
MNQDRQDSYLNRIERVLLYLNDHLDDDLDLDKLADVACFSRCHFHRIYRGMMEETVIQTVRRLRLHRASGELIRSNSDIAHIAKQAGYGSLEAFSRAFKASYGVAPASYRSTHQQLLSLQIPIKEMKDMFTVKIKILDPIKLACVDHQGDYMQVGKAFDKAGMWAAKHNLLNEQTKSIGIYYDDPSAVEEEKLRSAAGFVVDQDYDDPHYGLSTRTISGGRYAVLSHKGPYAELEQAYQWFFGPWLAQSGEEAAEAPCFECYLNDPKSTPPADLMTEIHMPLK